MSLQHTIQPIESGEKSLIVEYAHGFAIATIAESSLREYFAQVVGNELLELAHRARGNVVLRHDLVWEFGSSWINELLRLAAHCSGLGGKLVVLGMSERGEAVMKATGLDRRVTLVDSPASLRKALKLSKSDHLMDSLFTPLVPKEESKRAA
ncbi:MAG: hypothetical protein AABZ53_04150 [Planctomycetota bacterium]